MVNKTDKSCPLFCRGRGRPRSGDLTLSRDEILRKAFSAFAQHGYEGVPMRQLAADCGLSNTMLHHHFGTKLELWFEAADSVFAPLFAQLLALLEDVDPQPDLEQTLRNAMRNAMSLVGSNPETLGFLFREGEGNDARGEYLRAKYLQPYLARINGLLAAGKQSGLLGNVHEAGLHAVVSGVMRFMIIPGLLQQELAPYLRSEVERQRYIDEVVNMLFNGLLRHPAKA